MLDRHDNHLINVFLSNELTQVHSAQIATCRESEKRLTLWRDMTGLRRA